MLSSLALPSRRRWVTAAIGLGVQPGFNCIALSQPLPAKQGRAMVKQISLPYRLHSSPLAWPLGAAPGFAIAAVVAERQGADRMPFIAGFDGQGRMLPGFPWLRGTPMQVTPGHALVMASPQGDLAAINVPSSPLWFAAAPCSPLTRPRGAATRDKLGRPEFRLAPRRLRDGYRHAPAARRGCRCR